MKCTIILSSFIKSAFVHIIFFPFLPLLAPCDLPLFLWKKKTPLSSCWHTPTRTLTEISPDPPFPPSCASAIKETLPQGAIIYWSSPPRSLATYIICTNYLQQFLATQPFDCQPEIHHRLDLDPYKLQPHLNRSVLFAPNLFAVYNKTLGPGGAERTCLFPALPDDIGISTKLC